MMLSVAVMSGTLRIIFQSTIYIHVHKINTALQQLHALMLSVESHRWLALGPEAIKLFSC